MARFLDQAEPISNAPKKAASEGVELEVEVTRDVLYLLSIDPDVPLDSAAISALVVEGMKGQILWGSTDYPPSWVGHELWHTMI